jgi:hypothetical protein
MQPPSEVIPKRNRQEKSRLPRSATENSVSDSVLRERDNTMGTQNFSAVPVLFLSFTLTLWKKGGDSDAEKQKSQAA